MKNYLTIKLNGAHYLGILIIYRIVIVLLAGAIKYTNDSGAQIIGVMSTLPFLLLLLLFAYHRAKRIYSKPGLAFYIFVYSMIHVLIFGGSGFQDSGLEFTGQLNLMDSNPLLYWGIISGPLFALFALVYNCMIIFKDARKISNESGEHKDGLAHGQGTYTYADGDKYVGELKDNKPNGQGTYTWVSGSNKGDQYIGEFKDGLAHGQGTYTFSDGTVKEGLWENNEFVE